MTHCSTLHKPSVAGRGNRETGPSSVLTPLLHKTCPEVVVVCLRLAAEKLQPSVLGHLATE